MDSIISSSITFTLNFVYFIVSFIMKLWLVPINHIIEWIISRIQPLVEPLVLFYQQNKSKIVRISIYSVALVFLCAFISLINYGVLYSYFVPKVSSEEPLYFDFNGHRSVVAQTEVAVSFQRSQLYDIYLNLEMPESPKNEEIGMFMICLDLDSQDKWNPHKLLSVCRPATIKYRSPIMKAIRSVALAIPYLLGLYEEKQVLSVALVEDLPFKRFYQTVSVSISILNKNIQIYSANLSFQAKLSGLEYYMYHYPIFSFLVGFISLFITWLCIVSFVLVSIYVYRFFNQPQEQEEEEEEEKEKEESNQRPPLSSSKMDSKLDPNNNNNLPKVTIKKYSNTLFDSDSDDLLWDDSLVQKNKKKEKEPSLIEPGIFSLQDKSETPLASSKSSPTSSTITPTITTSEEEVEVKKEGLSDDGLVPEQVTTVGQTEDVPNKVSIDSDTSSALISSAPTTPSSSSSSLLEQESYGNSGSLVNEEWHMLTTSEDGDIIYVQKETVDAKDSEDQEEEEEEETNDEEGDGKDKKEIVEIEDDQERKAEGIRKRK